jgi:hypothetical protein
LVVLAALDVFVDKANMRDWHELRERNAAAKEYPIDKATTWDV